MPLNILLDAAGVQETVGLSPAQYMQAMMQSLIPQPVGIFKGQAMWLEADISKAAVQIIPLMEAGHLGGDVSFMPSARSVSHSNETQQEHAPVISSNTPAPNPEDFPDEMNQALACRFLGVSTNWLDKQRRSGLISARKVSETGREILFKKADLEALKELPVYKFRKRHGYVGGTILKADAMKKKPPGYQEPVPVVGPDSVMGDSAATDYLGVRPGVLAITRKDGTGPAWFQDNGVAKYRLVDLDAFKARMVRDELPQPRAQVIRKPEPAQTAADVFNLNSRDVAQFYGVKLKTVENWRTHKNGPEFIRDGTTPLYSLTSLRKFQETDGHRIQRSRELSAQIARDPALQKQRSEILKKARKVKAKKATANSGVKPATPKAKNATTLGGASIRH